MVPVGRRRLFAHIGLRKSGSTTIQSSLGRLAARLERCGIHVAVAGRVAWEPGAHHGLAAGDFGAGEVAWDRLETEASRCAAPRVVVSSELFAVGEAHASAERLARLGEVADTEIRLVAYVRPQWELAESIYCQRAKTGCAARPFDDGLDALLAEDDVFDYNRVFRPWRERFGERLSVFALDRIRGVPGLPAHFLGVLGCVDAGVLAAAARMRSENLRPGAKEVEVHRLVAAALRECDPAERRAAARQLRGALAGEIDDDLPFAGLSRDRVLEIERRFAASNARFARDYGIDAGGLTLRPPSEVECARSARSARAGPPAFTPAEKRRIARFVLAATGVALPADGCRWPAPQFLRVRAPARSRSRFRSLMLVALRLCRGRRDLGGAGDGAVAREWLRWELEWLWRESWRRGLRMARALTGAMRTRGPVADSGPDVGLGSR